MQKNAMNDDLLPIADGVEQHDRDRQQRRRWHRAPVLDVRHRPEPAPTRERPIGTPSAIAHERRDGESQAPMRCEARIRRASRTARRATGAGTRRGSSRGAGTSDRARAPSTVATPPGSRSARRSPRRSSRRGSAVTRPPRAVTDASAGRAARYVVKRRWIATPRKPVASASAYSCIVEAVGLREVDRPGRGPGMPMKSSAVKARINATVEAMRRPGRDVRDRARQCDAARGARATRRRTTVAVSSASGVDVADAVHRLDEERPEGAERREEDLALQVRAEREEEQRG